MLRVIPSGLFSFYISIEAGTTSAAGNLIGKAKGLLERIKKPSLPALSNQDIDIGRRETIRAGMEKVIRQLWAPGAGTLYFREKMTAAIKSNTLTTTDKSIAQVGAVRSYEMIGKYRSLPFVPDVKVKLTDHVLDRDLRGFLSISHERGSSNPRKSSKANYTAFQTTLGWWKLGPRKLSDLRKKR